MKQAILLALLFIVICKGLFAQTIPASQARQNFGKILTVEGKVYNFELTNHTKTTILYITRDFPYHDLAVIINDNQVSVKQHPELFINGKTISVKGEIFYWLGQPAIKVKEWTDITIKNTLKKHPAYMNNSPDYKPLASFKGDTLAYIFSNFIFNSGQYVNQSLDSIVKKSELPVRWYLDVFNLPKKDYNGTGMYLYFQSRRDANKKIEKKIDPGIVFVTFKNPMPHDSAAFLVRKYYTQHNDSLGFYYRKKIIDSMGYVHYHFRNEIPNDTTVWPHYINQYKINKDGSVIRPVD